VGCAWHQDGDWRHALFATVILAVVVAFWLRVYLHGPPSASAMWRIRAVGTAVLGLITVGTWVFDGLSVTAVVATFFVLAWSALLARERVAA
jgi:hypothetical protein